MIFAVIGHNTINNPEIFSSVRGFPGCTVSKAMFALYNIRELLRRREKSYRIGLLPHRNGDLGMISVPERRCGASISKVESPISDRCSC